MDGKQAIICKILDDANEKAQSIIFNANKNVDDKITDAEDFAKEYSTAQLSIAKKEAEEVIERRLIVADLDARKDLLSKKQQVISKVFDLAYAKLCSIDKKTYLDFVEKLVIEVAEDGDQVVLSKDEVLSKGDIEGLKVFKDKKLIVSKERGDFIGGVMLFGKNADKNLTFKAILLEKRDILASKVSQILFKVE